MKIKLKELASHKKFDSDLSHLVFNCLGAMKDEKVLEIFKNKSDKDEELELTLTLGGIELPVEKFFEHVLNQVRANFKNSVEEEAKGIVEEKFCDVIELFTDLQERINSEIEKRMEDWEKDDRNED